MEMPRTIHYFYGFPKELYKVQFPAKVNPEIAVQTKNLLEPTLVELDEKWGLVGGKTLLNYENLGQAFRLSVPTPEHYLP